MTYELVMQSLELAAERCEDLTPLVYERLFTEQPDMRALFWRDANHAVKGEMLAQAIEAVLDMIGGGRYGARMLQNEVVTHAGYDVPPAVFRTFFSVVVAALADLLQGDWTPDMAAQWQGLLSYMDEVVASALSTT